MYFSYKCWRQQTAKNANIPESCQHPWRPRDWTVNIVLNFLMLILYSLSEFKYFYLGDEENAQKMHKDDKLGKPDIIIGKKSAD